MSILASWIRKHKVERPRCHDGDDDSMPADHAGHDVDDGCQIDRPEGIDPLDSEGFARLRSILWADLQESGCSLRKIAALFGVSKNHVARVIDDIPDQVRFGRRPSERYFNRLRSVMSYEPSGLNEFVELMQREAGTLGFEGAALHDMGIRRSSVHTILGAPQRPRIKSKDDE